MSHSQILRNAILAEFSKAQTNRIIEWVGNSQPRFNELVKLVLANEHKIAQRAAWPLSYIAQAQPQLVQKHLAKLVSNLDAPNLHDGVKRSTVRFLQDMPVPEKLQGQLMDICFRFIEDPQEAIAIKAFSLTILGNLAQQYPDIIPELKAIVEAQLPYQSPAFKNRAKKVLASLNP